MNNLYFKARAPFTGGTINNLTVTGDTSLQGLTATTLNVNGVSITGDTYTTGGTYSNGTIDFYYNTGGVYQVTGLYTGQTSYVNTLNVGTGLSGDSTTGNVTIINTAPDQIVSISGGTNVNVTGTYPNFNIGLTGLTNSDTYTTGFTYNNNTFTISDNSGSTYNATINSVTGLTVNGILSATTISATTYSNTPIEIQAACSDEITALTTGTAKVTFRTPCAITVTAVRASLTTAQASGNIFTVDINEGGTSILSTKLTIDNTELTSTTATTPPVISDTTLADDAEITIDIDQIGDGTAKGLKVTIIGTRI